MNGRKRCRRSQGVEPLSASRVWGRQGGNSLRTACLMFLCDTRRSHWHALGSTPAPKYLGFFLANGCSFLCRWKILGMGVLG